MASSVLHSPPGWSLLGEQKLFLSLTVLCILQELCTQSKRATFPVDEDCSLAKDTGIAVPSCWNCPTSSEGLVPLKVNCPLLLSFDCGCHCFTSVSSMKRGGGRASESVPTTMGWGLGAGVGQRGTEGGCGMVRLTLTGSCMGKRGYTFVFSPHGLKVLTGWES